MAGEDARLGRSVEAVMRLVKSIRYSSLSRLEYDEALRLLGSTYDARDVANKLNQALRDIQTYLGIGVRIKVQEYLTWTSQSVRNPQAVPIDVVRELQRRSDEVLALLEEKLKEKRAVKFV
jgi:hypothetical protein